MGLTDDDLRRLLPIVRRMVREERDTARAGFTNPLVLPGSVTADATIEGAASVRLDGDSTTITATNLTGLALYATQRVMVELYPPHGSLIIGIINKSSASRTGVAVRRVANQSINHNALTYLAWDTEDFDSDGMFAVTSDTITIKVAGLYAIHCIAYPAAGVTWVYKLRQIELSGTVFAQDDFYVAAGVGVSNAFTLGIPVFPLVVNDTIKYGIQFQSTAGVAVNFTGRCYAYRLDA